MHPLKGRKQSSEHIAKRVIANQANPKWVQHSKYLAARNHEARRGQKHSEETKKKMSIAHLGMRNSLGCKRSLEFKKHLSEYWKDNPRHNHWVDGKGHERTNLRHQDSGRLEYRLWRTSVFERDNYTCQECKVKGGYLEADHIKAYSLYPELRYNISNGRTLCRPCHLNTPNFGTKAKEFYANSN